MIKRLFNLIFLFFFVISLPAFALPGKDSESTLTVRATGEVKTTPDIAKLTVTSTTTGATAQEATQLNATAATKLLNTLKSLGISEDDIRTGSISVFPLFSPDEVGTVIGYEASNSFDVTIKNVDEVGNVIDSISAAGDYTIGGVNFSLEDDAGFRDEAYKLAIQSAKHKADVVAKETNRSISGIKSINLDDFSGGIIFAEADTFKDASTPVLPGDVTVSASVTIEYFISR